MPAHDSSDQHLRARFRGRLWTVLKWALCLAVIVFVGKRAAALWNQEALRQAEFHLAWLLAAGGAYVAGTLPAVWFWRKLMQSVGATVRLRDAARAYYCGNLGKYVPGKASVLVIRAAMMRDRGCRGTLSALTATYETLMMMAAGLAVAVALSPLLLTTAQTDTWPDWIRRTIAVPWLPALRMILLCVVLLPITSRVLTHLAARMTPAEMLLEGQRVHIPAKLVGVGLLVYLTTWLSYGLSLGFALQSLSDGPLDLFGWPLWVGGISAATVIGFLAIFAPGGVGVREGLLIEILRIQPVVEPHQAVAAAVLLRLVWLAAEILFAGALYYFIKPQRPESETAHADSGRSIENKTEIPDPTVGR